MAKSNAQELPAGRLAGFEDDDTEDWSSFRRSSSKSKTRSRTAAAKAPEAGAAGEGSGAAALVLEVADAPAAQAPVAGKSSEQPEPSTGAASVSGEGTRDGEVPAYGDRANEIRSSSIHIPTPLLEKLVKFRNEHGMSNGQVVIAAIEKAHPKMPQLIHPVTAGGGGLFAQRATRGVRTTEGPLTPLNVRLYTQDYEVIDRLVEEFGAYSRGHLVTVSLTEFFDNV